MDFFSLPRKSLQLLCIRNKIPANTTNVAMATALASLQTVEALEELLQQSPTTTRAPNPIRSCRRSSSAIIVSVSKRSRTLSWKRNPKEKDEDPLQMQPQPPPLQILYPCQGTQGARQNAGVEKRRSIGIQVDIEDLEDRLLKFPAADSSLDEKQIESLGTPLQLLIENSLLEVSGTDAQCGHIIKNDQETNSNMVPSGEIFNKEINSSGFRNLQVASTPLPEPDDASLLSNVRDSIVDSSIDNRELSAAAHIESVDLFDSKITNASRQHCLELNRYRDISETDQETNSNLVPCSEISDKECIDALGFQNLQVANSKDSDPVVNSSSDNRLLEISVADHEVIRTDQETNSSSVPSSGIVDEEMESSVPSTEVANLPSDVTDPIVHSSFDIRLFETKVSIDASRNFLELNQCHNIFENDRETNSNLVTTSEIPDNVLVAISSQESTNMPSNASEGADMSKENEEVKISGEVGVVVKIEKGSNNKMGDLDGLSLRKLRLLYKVNKDVIKFEEIEGESESEEAKVHYEEEKKRLDGLSLRKLKFLYKNKVTQ